MLGRGSVRAGVAVAGVVSEQRVAGGEPTGLLAAVAARRDTTKSAGPGDRICQWQPVLYQRLRYPFDSGGRSYAWCGSSPMGVIDLSKPFSRKP
jgi:hypothetical protein